MYTLFLAFYIIYNVISQLIIDALTNHIHKYFLSREKKSQIKLLQRNKKAHSILHTFSININTQDQKKDSTLKLSYPEQQSF